MNDGPGEGKVITPVPLQMLFVDMVCVGKLKFATTVMDVVCDVVFFFLC
jgi:hypothetical protein